MIGIKPEDIKFESVDDVVDYVALGLPPTKKNYEKLRAAVGTYPTSEDSKINISRGAFLELDRQDLQIVLDRVYRDNCRNRNIVLAVTGAIVVGAIAAVCCAGKEDKKEKE